MPDHLEHPDHPLAAHTATPPAPWLQNPPRTLPVWAKILIAVLACPFLLGAGLVLHRNGVSLPVLIGAPATLVALRLYRRHAHRVR